jgi:hypothetical protein
VESLQIRIGIYYMNPYVQKSNVPEKHSHQGKLM